jgi:hypothetical protein
MLDDGPEPCGGHRLDTPGSNRATLPQNGRAAMTPAQPAVFAWLATFGFIAAIIADVFH